jgi:hypothetical protein
MKAAATLDLSGGDETPIQTAGRIVAGVVLLIVGAVIGLAFLAASLLGWLWPAIADWVDVLGDVLLIGAAIGLGIAVVGFELLRRGRRARRQEAAQASALVTALDAVGALDGTATPDQIQRAVDSATGGEPTGDLERADPATGGPRETHL